MDIQRFYWTEMTEVRNKIYYIDIYLSYMRKLNTAIKIITAIASSISIGAWAIWSKYSFIWSLIIAVSQVTNIIFSCISLDKQIKTINSFLSSLLLIGQEFQNNWFFVSNGLISAEEINAKLNELKIKYINLLNKHTTDIDIGSCKYISKKAELMTKEYFNYFYDERGDING